MREIDVKQITEAVAACCIDSCNNLPAGVLQKLEEARQSEISPLGCRVLDTIIDNARLSHKKQVPLCQDTGLTVVYIDVGQEVHFIGGDLWKAINDGVAKGYIDGYLRKSSVDDPLFVRKNTQDNTPAIIHCRIVSGDKVHLIVLPKGCGSENMSRLRMLKPADGLEGVLNFVQEAVQDAGPNPCPPVTVGVGIGGNAELAAELAKYALVRPIGEHNANPRYAELEDQLLELVNKTGVGPAGLGGKTTAIAVNVEYAPTHIGGLPCAIIFNCHAARRSEATI